MILFNRSIGQTELSKLQWGFFLERDRPVWLNPLRRKDKVFIFSVEVKDEPFIREKDAKMSSCLTQMRRNARTVAKLLSEPFVSFALMKEVMLPSKPFLYAGGDQIKSV